MFIAKATMLLCAVVLVTACITDGSNARAPFAYLYNEPDAVFWEENQEFELKVYEKDQILQFDDYTVIFRPCLKNMDNIICLESELPIIVPKSLNKKYKYSNYIYYAKDTTGQKNQVCNAGNFIVFIEKNDLSKKFELEFSVENGLLSIKSFQKNKDNMYEVLESFDKKTGMFLSLSSLCI